MPNVRISGELLAFLDARRIDIALASPAQLGAALHAIDGLGANKTLALELSEYVADQALRASNSEVWLTARRKAVEISPDPISFAALANCLEDIGDVEGALVALREAISHSLMQQRLVVFAALEMLRFCVKENNQMDAEEALRGLIDQLKQNGVAQEDISVELDMLVGLRELLGDCALIDQFVNYADKQT